MTELVSSEYLKSNTPRADRRQAAAVLHAEMKEKESRQKEGGSGWMKKEGGKVRMSRRENRLEQFIVTKQMVRLIYSKKGDGGQYQLGK